MFGTYQDEIILRFEKNMHRILEEQPGIGSQELLKSGVLGFLQTILEEERYQSLMQNKSRKQLIQAAMGFFLEHSLTLKTAVQEALSAEKTSGITTEADQTIIAREDDIFPKERWLIPEKFFWSLLEKVYTPNKVAMFEYLTHILSRWNCGQVYGFEYHLQETLHRLEHGHALAFQLIYKYNELHLDKDETPDWYIDHENTEIFNMGIILKGKTFVDTLLESPEALVAKGLIKDRASFHFFSWAEEMLWLTRSALKKRLGKTHNSLEPRDIWYEVARVESPERFQTALAAKMPGRHFEHTSELPALYPKLWEALH
ncbi:MAG: hypothetical protein AAF206_19090 [Bacteroidota bacterium]